MKNQVATTTQLGVIETKFGKYDSYDPEQHHGYQMIAKVWGPMLDMVFRLEMEVTVITKNNTLGVYKEGSMKTLVIRASDVRKGMREYAEKNNVHVVFDSYRDETMYPVTDIKNFILKFVEDLKNAAIFSDVL